MPSLPCGDPAPPTGELPDTVHQALAGAPFGVYVHVPYCRVRCGYCDFNTYIASELGAGADSTGYLQAVERELDLAERVLAGRVPPVSTVFVGGGTPTLLPPDALTSIIGWIRDRFALAADAEITTEANPDSVDAASLAALAEGGFTRVSFGMQSAVPHVLATLDRTHDPSRMASVVQAATAAGLATSIDLIYGTPGESLDDWRQSLDAAIRLAPGHLSAYALVVEEGTAMGAAVRRGTLPAPDPDDEADKYELADELLAAAGYGWYEVSNWARDGQSCRHNQGYWRNHTWWGLGPGAHSHAGGVRWWNVKHPAMYAARLADGLSPAAGRETLDADQRYEESVLLGIRLCEGVGLEDLRPEGRQAVAGLVADGLLDGAAAVSQRRAVLTLRGRLLADTVVRTLLSAAAI